MNNSNEDINTFFQREIQQMVKSVREFPWENETAYAHWLAQTYYLVRHTTTYLCMTAGGMSFEYPEQHQFLLHHLREETNHEMLAYADLESLGWRIEETPELLESQLMIQSQYYFIDKTPFAHYGFFWCLEKVAAEQGESIVSRLLKAYGRGSISFMQLHSNEDVKHSQEIGEMVSRFPQEVIPYIKKNIAQTCHLYSKMLEHIAHIAQRSDEKAA